MIQQCLIFSVAHGWQMIFLHSFFLRSTNRAPNMDANSSDEHPSVSNDERYAEGDSDNEGNHLIFFNIVL
jgi:hypothetical protein